MGEVDAKVDVQGMPGMGVLGRMTLAGCRRRRTRGRWRLVSLLTLSACMTLLPSSASCFDGPRCRRRLPTRLGPIPTKRRNARRVQGW